MDYTAKIEQFIADELLIGRIQGRINPDESLFASGVLDSLSILRLISFIEEQFDVVVDDAEVVPDNFQSINEINGFITKKIQEKQAL
jgi:acyl carrier protein